MNNLLDEIYKNLDNIKKLNPKGELNFFIEEFESEIKLLKENILELKNPFVLFIVGGGNYGKSTLINTLLNKNIIDTSDIPNT
jgi:ribosome biogenesis GTPase A